MSKPIYSVLTEAVVEAPIDEVWTALTTPGTWSGWNDTFELVKADLRVGGAGRLGVLKGERVVTSIPIRFEVVDEGRELRWSGGIPGVGGGSHFFQLAELEGGRTQILHGEDFRGFALGLLWPVLNKSIKERYALVTDQLAAHLDA